ncbi:MAG: hypothetical protein K9K66_12850 [Desulfarculaceae bacterium]|nr:hypothetical protein [Desulfarculaceae bacterium]MCF8072659.1 hypothetical protein [Desulfarculaceae bacterium]MCF8102538.1 hypothetical protein [Desulfarculaceae bacterium]MCF8116447.1 hypothetical protein [Desulfarculaceae bacterium]
MTKVEINAGACGFITTVETEKKGARAVTVNISSDCEAVEKMAAELSELGCDELLRHRFAEGPLAELAARTLRHNACPVISGVLKAAEVELGLNVPRTASIKFV